MMRRRTASSIAVCLAFLIAQIVVPSVTRASDQDYDLLRMQLDGLVSQRAALMHTLSDADGTVGALLARDVVQAARPVFALQNRLVDAGVQQVLHDPLAPLPATPVPDRSAGPGILLGAHLPVAQPKPRLPTRTPRLVQQAAFRQALLSAPALTLSTALHAGPVGPAPSSAALSGAAGAATGGLTLSPASGSTLADLAANPTFATGASALSPAGVPPTAAPVAIRPTYQPLGDAQDLAPVHAIQLGGQSLPLPRLAPQSVRAAPPVPSAPIPLNDAPMVMHGLTALRGYALAASTLMSTFDGLALPAQLSSTGLDPGQRVTNLDEVQNRLGHYSLNVPLRPSAIVPANAITPTTMIAPQVTWAFSATTPLTGGMALTARGAGHANGGNAHDLQLAAYSQPANPVDGPPASGTVLSLRLTQDGMGLLTAVTTLTDTTTISTTVQIDGLSQDSELQTALSRERLALIELGGVIPAGNAVYARLQPLYTVREQQYTQALSAVVRRNEVLEQAYWSRVTAYSTYQRALKRWRVQNTAYLRWRAQQQRAARASAAATAQAGAPATATPAPVPTTAVTPAGASPSIFGARSIVVPAGPAVSAASFSAVTAPDVPAVEQASARLAAPAAAITPVFGSSAGTATPPTGTPTIGLADTATPNPTETTPPTLTGIPTQPEATATAVDSATETPAATDTAGASSTPATNDTASETPAGTSTAAATSAATDTVGASSTPGTTGTASETPAGTSTVGATSTAENTAVASPTETPSQSMQTPGTTPDPTPLAPVASPSPAPDSIAVPVAPTVVPPPGPPPPPVPPPGLEPDLEPVPPAVLPLPGWVNAPTVFVAPTLTSPMAPRLNASGWAEMTRDQLIAEGALDNVGGYIPPLQGVITTYWGGSTPWQSFHPGIDIAAPKDTPVRAAADGIVVHAGLAVPGDPTLSYGNCVMIMHNSQISTLYGHMDLVPGLQVQVGQVVHRGQIIGYEGATGWATGPHVHFEMRLNNTQFNPLLLVDVQQITG